MLHRAPLMLLALAGTAHAGTFTVCPDGTNDIFGDPLSCDWATLQEAATNSAGAPVIAYGTFIETVSVRGPVDFIGGASQDQTKPILEGSLDLSCSCIASLDNFAFDNGGSRPMLTVGTGAVLEVSDGSLLDSSGAATGVSGAAAVVNGTLDLWTSTITGLHGGTGAPIMVDSGALYLTDVTSQNTTGAVGGLIQATNATVSIDGGDLSNAISSGRGGIVHASGSLVSAFNGAVLRDGKAGTDGGLIYANNSPLTVIGADLIGGTAIEGGAVYLTATSTESVFQDAYFFDNTSTSAGAAIRAFSSDMSITDSEISGNNSSSGAAITYYPSALTFERNLVTQNQGQDGAVINAAGPRPAVIADNDFIQNSATRAGGALVLSTELEVQLAGNLFEDNDADLGGAVYIDTDSGHDTVAWGNLYCANTATTAGGAIYTAFGTGAATFDNDVFIDNDAPTGGAFAATNDSDPAVNHATFLGNGASTDPSAGGTLVALDEGTSLAVKDTVIAHTGAGDGMSTDGVGSAIVSYSAFEANNATHYSGNVSTGAGVTTGSSLGLSFVDDRNCYNDDWDPGLTGPLSGTGSDGTDIGATGGDNPHLPGDISIALDSDGDGWADSVDCAPNDSDISPGAEEICDEGVDNDCDGFADELDPDGVTGTVAETVDDDGDGYHIVSGAYVCSNTSTTTQPGDCDDSDPDNYPGNTEVCDGQDNDCDNFVDDDDDELVGDFVYYEDDDNDFHGDPSRPLQSCDSVSLLPTVGDDCDDNDPDNYPGNDESCDGQDNDCDNAIDADDDDVIDAGTYFADEDGDGHGNANGAAIIACDSSLPTTADDCDDNDADNFPGNTEVCDGADNDCDTYADDADPEGVSGTTTFYADGDGDGYAPEGAATLLACAAESGWTETLGDCDDAAEDRYPGAAETCDARDEDCDGRIDEDAIDATLTYLDRDGDGYGDDLTVEAICGGDAGRVDQGGDCNDGDDTVYPGATEIPDDGIDQDCDAADLTDVDGDGWSAPEDCDDEDPDIHPGATDVPNDGIDQNCSPEREVATTSIGGSSCSQAPGGARWMALFPLLAFIRRPRRVTGRMGPSRSTRA